MVAAAPQDPDLSVADPNKRMMLQETFLFEYAITTL